MSKFVNAQRSEHQIIKGLLRLAKEEYLGEYYGQIKESLKALKLSKKTRILYGVEHSRIENIDILEFPVLFKISSHGAIIERKSTIQSHPIEVRTGIKF